MMRRLVMETHRVTMSQNLLQSMTSLLALIDPKLPYLVGLVVRKTPNLSPK